MDFDLNQEITNAVKEYQESMERYFAAKGKLEYLQTIAIQLQQENIHKENHNGVIAQSDFDLSASSS